VKEYIIWCTDPVVLLLTLWSHCESYFMHQGRLFMAYIVRIWGQTWGGQETPQFYLYGQKVRLNYDGLKW